MVRRIRSLLALGAVAALVLTGCSSDSTDGGTDSDGGTSSGGEAVVSDATVAALTGEPIEAGSLSRPALSAKIDNHPSARPQVGLDEADIVFEELVEGGMTRYLGTGRSSASCLGFRYDLLINPPTASSVLAIFLSRFAPWGALANWKFPLSSPIAPS